MVYQSKDQVDADIINAGIAFMFSAIDREKENIISSLGLSEFLLIAQLARTIEQTAQYLYEFQFLDVFTLRDQFMAENTVWVLDAVGDNLKVVLWGHNAHVADDPSFGSVPAQDSHLKNSLGEDYVQSLLVLLPALSLPLVVS